MRDGRFFNAAGKQKEKAELYETILDDKVNACKEYLASAEQYETEESNAYV